jgi:hypothetical protein
MDQYIPNYTSDEFDRVLAREFPRKVEEARATLGSYGSDSSRAGQTRVWMACLKVASGDLKRLDETVQIACADYRDVLASAEYPTYFGAKTDEEKANAISFDKGQLLAWLRRE